MCYVDTCTKNIFGRLPISLYFSCSHPYSSLIQMTVLSCFLRRYGKIIYSRWERIFHSSNHSFTSIYAWELAVVPMWTGMEDSRICVSPSSQGGPVGSSQDKIARKTKKVLSKKWVLSIPLQSYLSSPISYFTYTIFLITEFILFLLWAIGGASSLWHSHNLHQH